MNNVRAYREANGLSQRRLAELSHTPAGLLSSVETGRMKPWPALAKRLSRVLKVEIGQLFPDDLEALSGKRK